MTTPLSIVPAPTRIHKHWLHAYVDHNDASESPPYIHYWTGVWTIASALGRRVWFPQRTFDWTPNVYVIFVGPAGIVGKTSAIDGGLDLLREVLDEKHFGPDSATWQALADKMQRAEETITIPGVPKPQIMSCLTIAPGELGTFFRADNKELVDVLIPLYDSKRKPWVHSTKNHGETVIQTPCLNFISATTPDWLEDNFTKQVLNGGLGSRIIFVYAEAKVKKVAFQNLQIPSAKYAEVQEELVHDLRRIAKLAGEFDLTPEAYNLCIRWYDEHWSPNATPIAKSFQGWRARKQAHLIKLVMIISVSKRDDLIGTEDDVKEALYHLSKLEKQMEKIYDSVGLPPSARALIQVRNILERVEVISSQDLWQTCHTMEQKHYQDAIRSLLTEGMLRIDAAPGGKGRIITWIGPQRKS